MVLIESENKRSVDTPASNDRKTEIQRIVKLLLDSSQGLTSVACFAMTHAVRKFINTFNNCVKRRKDGSLIEVLERWLVGTLCSCSRWNAVVENIKIQMALVSPSNKLLWKLRSRLSLWNCWETHFVVLAWWKHRHLEEVSQNTVDLFRLYDVLQMVLLIEKYVNEVKMFLESLDSLSSEDERLVSELDFGPKVYPIERAKRLQPKFVGVSMYEILELLVAFEGRYTDDEVAAELRRELSLRPRCSKGHELRPALRNGNFCDLCNANGKRKNERGTSFRCSRGCDFDVRVKSHVEETSFVVYFVRYEMKFHVILMQYIRVSVKRWIFVFRIFKMTRRQRRKRKKRKFCHANVYISKSYAAMYGCS